LIDAEELDPIRILIRERAREVRLTMAELSRHMGRNPTYLHQYIRRRHPAVLPEDARGSLARLLGLPEDALRSPGRNRGAATGLTAPPLHGLRNIPSSPPRRDVPVFADSQSVDPVAAIEWTERPPILQAAAGSFALWISSARGRLRPGDLAFVRGTQPPRVGDAVVALKGKEVVAIGDLVSLEPENATVEEAAETRLVVRRQDHRVMKIVCINTG
jgi:hypothetical protein